MGTAMAATATIGDDLAMALDPVRFALAAGIVPDEWQARLLRSASKRTIINVARQMGKSSISAVLAVHTILYQPGALVLLVSPSLRQSGELFRKALTVYRDLGRPIPAEAETALTLQLGNGSRLVSLPGSEGTVRGYSAARLIIEDEASRAPDDLYRAIRPMLAVSDGRLILMSTPWGKRGHFFEEWTNGGESWERIEVPASQCSRISPAFLAAERRALGRWFYAQEWECQFSETTDQLFSHDVVMAAITPDVKPLFGGKLTWDIETETETVPG